MNIVLPVEDRSPLPVWFIPSFLFFLVVSIALSPGPFRTAATFPIITLFVCTYGHFKTGNSFGERYALGFFFVGGIFKYIDLVLLANADREQFRPVKCALPSTKPSLVGSEVPRTFLPRALWAWNIISIYLRGFGWTNQVKNIPTTPPVDYSKWKFVLLQTLQAALVTLLADTSKSFMASTSAGAVQGSLFNPLGYYSEPIWRQLLINACNVIMVWSLLTLQASVIYAITVGVGLYKPEDCPPAWGAWRNSYTVRNLWGKTWHQFLRRTASMLGEFVARDVLRLRKGTWLSRYTKLSAGFLASGLIHSGAVIYSCGHDTGDLAIFLSQVIVICLEDHIIALGRKLGFRDCKGWRGFGYIWTWAWLLFSWRWWVGPLMAEGLGVFPKPVDVFGFVPSQSMAMGGGMVDGHAGANKSNLLMPVPELLP